MTNDFNLTSVMKNDVLVITTDGYINNAGGEKIYQEFDSHFNNGITKLLIDMKSSKVVNSIGISFLIEIIEKLTLHYSIEFVKLQMEKEFR
jgi:hypothetical protein